MNKLFLRPLDVWLFRDGRPFDAGSIHRAESMFPPYPSVIQGALRTHQLNIKNVDVNDKAAVKTAVGDADNHNGLKVRGPFVAKRKGETNTLYFPQPANAILEEKETSNGKKVFWLRPASRMEKRPDTLKSSQTLHLLGHGDKSGKQTEALWLDFESLQKYLGGDTVQATKASELFQREPRTGIGMKTERVGQDGMLYEAEFIRPAEGVGLLIEMNYGEDEWMQPGILHLGGERHMAQFEKADQFILPAIKPVVKPGKGFIVYFATPALFEKGWKPSTWSKFFEDIQEDDLMAAAINRYETVGGFDWSANSNHESAHRPARRFVPAGSVYYFKNSGDVSLKTESITDYGAEIGFGQIIIKEW